MLGKGASWSGYERNNCYLNLGDARFADASFVSGLDFADDGRALAVVDHDGDGHLDLWLKNRTGPQLRFMHNRGVGGPAHWISLALQGVSSNRDAIGADVRVHYADRVGRRFVAAGDGYLSQSSPRLHFGLGAAEAIDRIVVRWPGGATETFDAVPIDRRYRLVEGTGRAEPIAQRTVVLESAPPTEPAPPGPVRVVLKTPLPLPPTLTAGIPEEEGPSRATLINLWAQWCEPCRSELVALADSYAELRASGVKITAWTVDEPEDHAAATQFFKTEVASRMSSESGFRQLPASEPSRDVLQAILRHVLIRHEELVLPTSLLVDAKGRLQVIYLGAVDPAILLQDVERWITTPVKGARRSMYGGRWYFRSPRDLVGLAADLRGRGLKDDARFYLALDRLRQVPGERP